MDWGILGHAWAVELLAEHVASQRERHAYLITGPQGVGRRTLAVRFTQAINCLQPTLPGQPCRTCSACRRIEHMQYPDLTIVESMGVGETLRIDQVRELQRTLSLAPYEGHQRVALILRFEEAHINAANALLKTLEEPPGQAIVLLTAASAESLLPTIVSRCEVIRLRPLAFEELAEGLQRLKGMQREEAENLAHISEGRPGFAIRLYEQPVLLEERKNSLARLMQLLASSRRERFALARNMVENKDELRRELQVWLTFWRDVLVCSTGLIQTFTNLDFAAQIQTLADEAGINKAQSYVNAVERTLDQIDRNVNARLAVEVLLLDLPKAKIAG